MEEIRKRIKSREFSALIRRENIDDVAKVIALYRAVRMNRNDRFAVGRTDKIAAECILW